ncbi:hypothetical protein ACSBR1_011918 [Camellia fascicularis]
MAMKTGWHGLSQTLAPGKASPAIDPASWTRETQGRHTKRQWVQTGSLKNISFGEEANLFGLRQCTFTTQHQNHMTCLAYPLEIVAHIKNPCGLIATLQLEKSHSSIRLTIIDPGILALVNSTSTVIWSVNVTGSTQKPIAQLMDSGNLVVKDANDKSEHFLWQSFDYPCDTHLPGMKLGKNFETGLECHLSSWNSRDDPARGEFIYRCDPQGYPQNIVSSGSVDLFRTGLWNGIGFSGRPNLKPNPFYTHGLVYSKEEVYYHYELPSPVVSRYDVSYDGHVRHWIWVDQKQKWDIYQSFPTDNCDTYKLCGPNGNNNIGNSPACGCLSKFVPRNETEWRNGDYSNGCSEHTVELP